MLKLMCIFAHPDDESLGCGGTLAHYAAEGVETTLVCATRGERGWGGVPANNPGLTALGQIREAELRAAGAVLGLHEIVFLDYLDGDLDQANPAETTAKIVSALRRVRPHVVITFGPEGAYGHPDHIAISQLAGIAVLCAADAQYADPQPPHAIDKFYYMVDSKAYTDFIRQWMGGLGIDVDGVRRELAGWEEWAITTRLDVSAHWRTTLKACLCHTTQVSGMRLPELPDDMHQRLWGKGFFYRALSRVNGGRRVETDLFEGLRNS